jgi:hypothetical protein
VTFAGTINGSTIQTVTGIGVDPKGNILFGGYSTSTDLPIIGGPGKPSDSGVPSSFVGRIAPSAK